MRLLGPISIQNRERWQLTGFLYVVLLTFFLPVHLSPPALAQTADPNVDLLSINGENALILGQPCTRPYVVAIPANSFQLLDRVQLQVPSAFLTDSPLGSYVLAGAFAHRLLAESLESQLRYFGFDARVLYKPIACSSTGD